MILNPEENRHSNLSNSVGNKTEFYINKQIYNFKDKIIISYRNVEANVKNWIGIWRFIDGHGANGVDLKDGPWHQKQTNSSNVWTALTQENGEFIVDTSRLSPGRYAVFLLEKDGYKWLSQPIIFDIANQNGEVDLKVLTFNIWHEGTQVPRGYDGIVNEILATNADIISLSEVRNYQNTCLTQRLIDSLNLKGVKYYSYKSENDVGILSRYPIKSRSDFDRFTKSIIQVNDIEVAFYSTHLDYKNYAAHLPRGYNGNNSNELPAPVTDVNEILAMNNASHRPHSIRTFINNAKEEINAGRIIIMTGDFNEPSWLDWSDGTCNMFDHRGAIVPWTSTKLLNDAGYQDSYRVKYPDAVEYPGFTWLADNLDASIEKLTWAPKADDRDRVDFIFYYPNKKLFVKDAIIVGPSSSIVKSERIPESGKDSFKVPETVWPSDHKAVLTTFRLVPRHSTGAETLLQRGRPDEVAQKDHRRWFSPHPTQSTGLWCESGDILEIVCCYQGNMPSSAPVLWIYPIAESADAPERKPRQSVQLSFGTQLVTVENQGIIYFAAPNFPVRADINVQVVKGAYQMPRYVAGKDTQETWNQALDNFKNAPYGELVGQRMIVAMPLPTLTKHVDTPKEVTALWDKIVSLAEECYGLHAGYPRPHQPTPFQYIFETKPSSMSGYMSASNAWLGTNFSGAYSVCNSHYLNTEGWGPWHELGHHYQLDDMRWDGLGEVTVNIVSLYVQRALHGRATRLDKVWPEIFVYFMQEKRDYSTLGLFHKVAMFWQLLLTFGKDFYARLGQRYRTFPDAERPRTSDEKIQKFILEASQVAGFNLLEFFNMWGLAVSSEAQRELNVMRLPTLDTPIWENTDTNCIYQYALSEQNISGQLGLPEKIHENGIFEASVSVINRESSTLRYQWEIPEGFSCRSTSGGSSITLVAPAGILQHSSVLLRVTVTDAQGLTMAIGGKIYLEVIGEKMTYPSECIDSAIMEKYNVKELHTWDGSSRDGNLGDIYYYDNPHSNSRDYFRLKSVPYWYFPTNQQDNRDWEFLFKYTTQYHLGNLTSGDVLTKKNHLFGFLSFPMSKDLVIEKIGAISKNGEEVSVDFTDAIFNELGKHTVELFTTNNVQQKAKIILEICESNIQLRKETVSCSVGTPVKVITLLQALGASSIDGGRIFADINLNIFNQPGKHDVQLYTEYTDGQCSSTKSIVVYVDNNALNIIHDRITGFADYPMSQSAFLQGIGATTSDGSVIVTDINPEWFKVTGEYTVNLSAGHDGLHKQKVVLSVAKSNIQVKKEMVSCGVDTPVSEAELLQVLGASSIDGSRIFTDMNSGIFNQPGKHDVQLYTEYTDGQRSSTQSIVVNVEKNVLNIRYNRVEGIADYPMDNAMFMERAGATTTDGSNIILTPEPKACISAGSYTIKLTVERYDIQSTKYVTYDVIYLNTATIDWTKSTFKATVASAEWGGELSTVTLMLVDSTGSPVSGLIDVVAVIARDDTGLPPYLCTETLKEISPYSGIYQGKSLHSYLFGVKKIHPRIHGKVYRDFSTELVNLFRKPIIKILGGGDILQIGKSLHLPLKESGFSNTDRVNVQWMLDGVVYKVQTNVDAQYGTGFDLDNDEMVGKSVSAIVTSTQDPRLTVKSDETSPIISAVNLSAGPDGLHKQEVVLSVAKNNIQVKKETVSCGVDTPVSEAELLQVLGASSIDGSRIFTDMNPGIFNELGKHDVQLYTEYTDGQCSSTQSIVINVEKNILNILHDHVDVFAGYPMSQSDFLQRVGATTSDGSAITLTPIPKNCYHGCYTITLAAGSDNLHLRRVTYEVLPSSIPISGKSFDINRSEDESWCGTKD